MPAMRKTTPDPGTARFAKPGRQNTAAVCRLAAARAQELGINHFVVASNTGATALKLAAAAPAGSTVVCVTHHAGFRAPGEQELTPAARRRLERAGIGILTTTHLFAGVERAARMRFGGLGPAETIAWTYRTFGEGTKVAVEVSVMALDAGLVPHGTDIIAVGGTGRGADTALVIRPAHSRQFFETAVRETVCKPRAR
jgi:hypothetical protein